MSLKTHCVQQEFERGEFSKFHIEFCTCFIICGATFNVHVAIVLIILKTMKR